MQTLKQLNNNELIGSKELTLRENLTTFPEKIFELADTLEFLDLSNNNLSSLPDLKRLTKLKFVFFSYNQFREFPTSFKECHNLYMIGCKANQIEVMDEDILPVNLSWFIITDNKLKSLPNSIGDLTKLKKFSLAGNQLSNLPTTMQNCTSLELLRLSANKLSNIPEWIATLPKLSWIAFSGNTALNQSDINPRGHAIECRINAEDASKNFQPSPGTINMCHQPSGFRTRVDGAIFQGYKVTPYYDSMVCKLICHGRNRTEAIQRMNRSLDEFVIEGITTTIPLHKKLLNHKKFINSDFNVSWLDNDSIV